MACFPAIGALPCLVHLSVSLQDEIPLVYQPGSPMPSSIQTSKAFRLLETLEISTWSPSEEISVVAFLQHIPPTNVLKSVECRLSPEMRVNDRKNLVDTLHSHLNPDTLECVTVSNNFYGVGQQHQDEDDLNRYDLPFRDEVLIRPLFAFKKLKAIVFRVFEGVQLMGTDIHHLPPHLVELDLRPLIARTSTPYLDHSHILELLRTRPSLRVLGVPFDGTRVTGTEAPSEPGCEIKLEVLKTWGSMIASPSRTAAFFRTQFPNLKRMDVDPRNYVPRKEGIERKRWRGVSVTLGLL